MVSYCLDARIIISLPAFRAYEARAVRKSGGGVLDFALVIIKNFFFPLNIPYI